MAKNVRNASRRYPRREGRRKRCTRATGWRTLNFNTQPLSELAKADVMAIRAALSVARWLPFALVAIIKMHYSPSARAPSGRLLRLLFTRLQPVLFLWKTSRLSSFPPSVSLSASRPFLRLFTLYVAENSTPSAGSSSLLRSSSVLPRSSCTPAMLAERKREEELLPPSPSFQFKFASAQEHGAFHSQTRPCLSRLDQRRAFRHLINPPTGVRVYQVQEHWDPNSKIPRLSSVFID